MKKFLVLSTLVTSLLLVGGCSGGGTPDSAGPTEVAKPAEKAATVVADAPKAEAAAKATAAGGPRVIIEKEDKKGDDNGPGTYTYPTDKVFVPGSFDLTKFTLIDDGKNYVFKVQIPIDFKNDWKLAGGWDVQQFDIYINLGAGKHKQTIQGRHVKIAEGWDKALLIEPEKPQRVRKEVDDKNTEVGDDVSQAESLVEDVILPDEITTEGNTITAKIEKSKFADLNKFNGVQVFMVGSEGYPTKSDTLNRVVNEYSAQWRFGGGNDYEGDPNVIDILGDNADLKNYKSDEGVAEYTTVHLVK